MSLPVRHDVTLLAPQDLYLLGEGTHRGLYDKLGSHPMEAGGESGTYFAVWAPNARQVTVMGDFNGWDRDSLPLCPRDQSGVWEGFVPGAGPGARYKYHVVSRCNGYRVDKADPFAAHCELPPQTASVIWNLEYAWNDREWLAGRAARQAPDRPWSIYEVHLGSWMRVPEEGNRWLTYRELAPRLVEHLTRTGFTHVEFLPVMEHPLYASWGYQVTAYFAPTSRYGTPQDFMFLVDFLHQHGLGVILDWVPAHFPADPHGLGYFDGTHLYEHADPRQGFHPDWGSLIYNYGRGEVRSFLTSSAMFWLDRYHADGLRVDGVASMLYLDYSRKEGEWLPNEFGGRENLHAISLLRQVNAAIHDNYPGARAIAEESTAWPVVSRPPSQGGLGFDAKWDMGWMHDTLAYLARDPIHRKYHHDQLTFRSIYAFTENFILALSHDEVVHGKGSLLGRMPGDQWQKFANLRALFGFMYAQPGKKLLFMGGEFGQGREWNHDASLDWHLLSDPLPAGLMRWVGDLNHLYRSEPALHELDFDPAGFIWVDGSDADASVISFTRRGRSTDDVFLVVCHFTPVVRENYRIGVPTGGHWQEVLCSDAREYGGSGVGNLGGREADPVPAHGRPFSLSLTLPPLAVLFFRSPRGEQDPAPVTG